MENDCVNSLFIGFNTPSPVMKRRRAVDRQANGGGDSYLDMWKKAVDRERKTIEFEKIAENKVEGGGVEDLGKRNSEFEKLLEVDRQERDRVQRMQVIDRAAAAIAAAIAAARALLKEGKTTSKEEDESVVRVEEEKDDQGGVQKASTLLPDPGTSSITTPGPNFWAWIPPPNDDDFSDEGETMPIRKASPSPPERCSFFIDVIMRNT